MTTDGDVVTGMLGFDAEWPRVLAGLLLAHSEGDGTYSLSDGSDRGTMESALTGVYPYARLRLGGRLSVWGLAGVGSGDLSLMRQDEPSTPIWRCGWERWACEGRCWKVSAATFWQ